MSEMPPYQPMQGFSNYPRGIYNPDPFRRPPGVYFDQIGQAFQLVSSNLGTWVLAMLIFGGIYVGAAVIMEVVLISMTVVMQQGAQTGLGAGVILVFIVVYVAFLFVCQTMTAGLLMMGVKQARNEPLSPADIFCAWPRSGVVILATLVQAILGMVGFCLLIVPAFWVSGLLAFMPILVVEQRLGAIEAVQVSWDNLRPHAWALFALVFVAGLIGIAGELACFVGLLFTVPVYASILGLAYNNFFPKDAPQVVYNQQPIGYEGPH